jgi:hypothetical protein
LTTNCFTKAETVGHKSGDRSMTLRTSPQQAVQFSPFDAIVEDGLERVLSIVKSETFPFIVNGRCFESPFAQLLCFHRQFMKCCDQTLRVRHSIFPMTGLTQIPFFGFNCVVHVKAMLFRKTKHCQS